jgi:hypothetical protein
LDRATPTTDILWEPLRPRPELETLPAGLVEALASFWARSRSRFDAEFPDFAARLELLGKPNPEILQLQRSPLDVPSVKHLHALVTRDQAAVPAKMEDGTWRHVALAHGRFKQHRNEARQRGGRIQHFAPPERVEKELQVLLAEHARLRDAAVAARAAWLLGGFLLTHPFADGNGRVARYLGDVDLLSVGLPAVRAASDVRAAGYLDAVEATSDSYLPLAAFITGEAELCVINALRAVEASTIAPSWNACHAEQAAVQRLRHAASDDYRAIQGRLDAWGVALGEVGSVAFPHGLRDASSRRGAVDAGTRERAAAVGVRARRGAPSRWFRVGDGWDSECHFDVLPMGTLGVDAYIAIATPARTVLRDRPPSLLLTLDEGLEDQVSRLAAWAERCVCALGMRSLSSDS